MWNLGWFFILVTLSALGRSIQVRKQEVTEDINLRSVTEPSEEGNFADDQGILTDEEIENLSKEDLTQYVQQEIQKSVVKRAAEVEQISSSSGHPPKFFQLDKYKKAKRPNPAPFTFKSKNFSKKFKFSKREADPEPEPEPEPHDESSAYQQSSYQRPSSYYSYRYKRELESREKTSKNDAEMNVSKRKANVEFETERVPEPVLLLDDDHLVSRTRGGIASIKDVKSMTEGMIVNQTIGKKLSKMIKTAKEQRRTKRSEDDRKKPSFSFSAPDFSYTVEDVTMRRRRKRHIN